MKDTKFYVVSSFEADDDITITKTFRYRKCANKYGMELVEKYGHCFIDTYINTEKVERENY